MMLRISVVAQMNVFCFPTIFVVKAAYINLSVISNMIRDRIRSSLLWGGAMPINGCLYYTGFCGFFNHLLRLMTQLLWCTPDAPLHSFYTVMHQKQGRRRLIIKIHVPPRSLFKCFRIPLVSDIGIHHSRHGVDLLLIPLLHQLSVSIGIFHGDAVTHCVGHQFFVK